MYKKMVADPNIPSIYQGILNPKNIKQAQNHKSIATKAKKICQDDIYNSLVLTYKLDNFLKFEIYPDLVMVVANKKSLVDFNQLLELHKESTICLHYDNTFEIGNFYVSPLLYRNILFEKDPVIPLAFLVHERKYQRHHQAFFAAINEKVPNFKKATYPS